MVYPKGESTEARPGHCPLGFALAVGFATCVCGCLIASLAAPPQQTAARLAVLALIIGGFAAVVRNLPGSLLTAVIAWSMYLGFLVDQAGELRWHGGTDLLRLGVLVAAAVAGSGRWPVRDLLSARHAHGRVRTFGSPEWRPRTAVRAPGDRAQRAH
jgi:hypothetical protein